MDKYVGMNKVDVKLSANGEVVKKKKEGGGLLKTFLLQSVTAVILGCVLFAAKFAGGRARTAAETVRAAVCFDAAEYVRLLIDEK